MKLLLPAMATAAFSFAAVGADVHVWEKVELTFHAKNPYANPYTNVEVWVDLKGPEFDKRCFGFWDGSNVFRVRVLATQPGKWTWQSGSNQKDDGLNNQQGSFSAVDWSEAEKSAVPTRRGFIRPATGGHAFEYADGTPFLLLGDTWYAAATFRFKWNDDDRERPIGPEAGFKDYLRLRQSQGFNSVVIIAAFPNWANDWQPWEIWLDKTREPRRAVGMGGPGRNRQQKAARSMARQGHVQRRRTRLSVPRQSARLRAGLPGRGPHQPGVFQIPGPKDRLPECAGIHSGHRSGAARHHLVLGEVLPLAGLLQPLHPVCLEPVPGEQLPLQPGALRLAGDDRSAGQLNQAANQVIEKYGAPPFGTLVSCNASVSSLLNFGGPEENQWLTFHQIGNLREHDAYWYLTDIFHAHPPRPALNGEPYYSGMADKRYTPAYKYGAPGGTEQDDLCVRSGIYGSFLSGGLAGHIYGAEGIWGADIEPGSSPFMWEAFQWNSANQMRHLKTFALSEGRRYQDLVPDANLVVPNQTHEAKGFTGWAYCARTPGRDFFLAYFEKDCPNHSMIRGATPHATYDAQWFDPRSGQWSPAGAGRLTANVWGWINVPDFPANDDWGLKLTLLD